jgi:hypothetical protein
MAQPGPPPAQVLPTQREVRAVEDGFEWCCPTCSSWSELEHPECAVCGTPFRLHPEEDAEPVERDPNTVLVASAVLPGVGHVLLGRLGDGLVRASTYAACVVGAWLLIRAASPTGLPLLPAAPLLVGAVALWVMTVVDGQRLAAGRREQLLTTRVYLWLVVGVLGLLVAAFLRGLLRVGQLGG